MYKNRFSLLLAAVWAFFGLAVASFVPMPAAAAYSTSVSRANTTLTFGYEGSIETLTVPDNVSEITITVAGGEGGQGGNDSPGRPPREGYKGVVTGTVSVSAGQVISVAVGARGEALAAFFRDNGVDVRFVISDQGLSKYAGAKARKVTIKSFWRKFTS